MLFGRVSFEFKPRRDRFFPSLAFSRKIGDGEILVSNLCDCRLPLLIGGRFHSFRLARSTLAMSSGVQPHVGTRPDIRLFRLLVFIVFLIVFSIVFHCSCVDGFSQARAKACIVFGAYVPL